MRDDAVARLLRAAEQRHWRDVVGADCDSTLWDLRARILDRRAGLFYIECAPPRSARVLELGAGVGTITGVLADYYRLVVACENDPTAVRFLAKRFAQDGQTNVRVINAGKDSLPLPPGTFDFIVVNGGFELPGTTHRAGPSDHAGMLAGWRDLLGPGGSLALAAANRNTLGPVVPPTTNSDHPARAHRYTAGGYRRLLQQTGFSDIEVWTAFPDHATPSMLVRFDDPRLIRTALRRSRFMPRGKLKSLAVRTLLRLGWYRHVASGFVVLATRK